MKHTRLRGLTMMVCLGCMLTLLFLSACSGSQSAPTQAGKNQPLTFSFYGNYDWLSYSTKWGSDATSKWILQNKKVTINFVNSNGASAQKLNQMIASSSLPDVIMLDRGSNVDRLIKAHDLVPLDAYFNKYPNFKKYVGEATLNLLRSSDGHIYQMPDYYIAPSGSEGQYWTIVNTKIYNALNAPRLDTFDELESYLLKVKAAYPDVVPLDMISGDFMCSAFAENRNLADVGMFGYPQGNQIQSIFADASFADCMKYTSRLFREKLISQDMFTQTQDQIKEKLNNGKIAIYMGWDGGDLAEAANSALKSTFLNPAYKAIRPIYQAGLDPKNVNPGYYNRVGWNVAVITKKARDPEAIFAYLDWATSPEGQRILNFGPQGLFWDSTNAQGVPLPNSRYATVDKSTLTAQYGLATYNFVGNTTFIDTAKQARNALLPPEQRDWETDAQSNIAFKTSTDVTEFTNITPDPTSPEGIDLQRLQDLYNQDLAKMVFAGSDNDVLAIIQQMQSTAQNDGIAQLLSYETQHWQANRKQMGLQ